MKIYGFEIKLNGELLCRAGFESEKSVLTCILDSIRREQDLHEEVHLSVSGLKFETDQHVSWVNKALK